MEHGSVCQITALNDRIRTNWKGITGYWKDKEGLDVILQPKKFKLFLCSKDIQVGEKAYCTGEEQENRKLGLKELTKQEFRESQLLRKYNNH